VVLGGHLVCWEASATGQEQHTGYINERGLLELVIDADWTDED